MEIYSGGEKFPICPSLYSMPDPVKPPARHVAALVKSGKNPTEYDSYPLANKLYLTMPKLVTTALLAARDEERARIEAIRNDPVNKERRRISAMYCEAKKHINHPGDYYGMLAEADAALKKWQEKYPLAAAKEKAAELRSRDAEQDRHAAEALVYDAGG